MRAQEVYDVIRAERLVVIVRGVGIDVIGDVADAVCAGGCGLLEITCNTEGAAEMIGKLCKEQAGRMVIGAGTVITKELCEEVLAAGAEYVIAPDVNPEVITHCVENDVAVIPGAATATEVLTAWRLGTQMVKIFPAGLLGTGYIRMLRGPIDDVDFLAVGGVGFDRIENFIAAGCVGIGIGDSVLKTEFIENRQWGRITELVSQYVEKLAQLAD